MSCTAYGVVNSKGKLVEACVTKTEATKQRKVYDEEEPKNAPHRVAVLVEEEKDVEF